VFGKFSRLCQAGTTWSNQQSGLVSAAVAGWNGKMLYGKNTGPEQGGYDLHKTLQRGRQVLASPDGGSACCEQATLCYGRGPGEACRA
jgi:hypothetical protein